MWFSPAGVNNAFLIATRDPLALLYNDVSVLILPLFPFGELLASVLVIVFLVSC